MNKNILLSSESSEANEVLGNLSKSVKPSEVNFQQMTKLMHRCEVLDLMQRYDVKEKIQPKGALERANVFGTNALNLLSGILPGNFFLIFKKLFIKKKLKIFLYNNNNNYHFYYLFIYFYLWYFCFNFKAPSGVELGISQLIITTLAQRLKLTS